MVSMEVANVVDEKGAMLMGCVRCPSGRGMVCEGPFGLYASEVQCDCECHRCKVCYSFDCIQVGGIKRCYTPCMVCGLPNWMCDCVEVLPLVVVG